MSEVIATVLTYIAIFLLAVVIGGALICAWFDRCDWPWEASPEEIARREAERVAKQATKDFKKRQRLRTLRFWNF